MPSFGIESGGRALLKLDASGRLSVATSGLFSPASWVTVTVDSHILGFLGNADGSSSMGWLEAPRVGPLVRVPGYSGDVGFTCDVGPELEALSSALLAPSGALPAGAPTLTPAGSGACATRDYLRCYLGVWNSPVPSGGRTYAEVWREEGGRGVTLDAESAFLVAQAAQNAATCAAGRAGPNAGRTPTLASFVIGNGGLLFSPSPLFSIAIYAGDIASYDEALVQSEPAALVPAATSCTRPDKSCVASPLPLARCKGCEKLAVGRTYTAFLLGPPGELRRDVKRVVFKR